MLFLRFPKGKEPLGRGASIGVMLLFALVIAGGYSAAYKAIKQTSAQEAEWAQIDASDDAIQLGDSLLKGAKFVAPASLRRQPINGMHIKLNWYQRSKVYTVTLTGYESGTCEAVLLTEGGQGHKIVVSGYDKDIPDYAVHDVCKDTTGTITVSRQG